ncbi:MAG: ABC transporter ATP-binding protein [Vicingaceae bacterium]
MNKVLEIKGLTIGFPGKGDLVKNLSLSINRGELHGLIGESGSGKSLTALSIIGLLPRNCSIKNGSILLHSKGEVTDLVHLPMNEMRSLRGREVGFVFQDPMTALNPVLRCGKQVEEAISQHRKLSASELKKEVLKLFAQVRLPDPEKAYYSYPHQVSGGQRQRILIAQAISCKPKLLIADEITTALDVEIQVTVMELLADLRRSLDVGILFISHDLGLVGHYADEISIMHRGQIVESGPKESILKNPKEAYTKGLLACRPPVDKKIDRLPTVEDFLLSTGEVVTKEVSSSGQNSLVKEILVVKGLSTFYPMKTGLFGQVTKEFQALKEVSFKVLKGESLGLVGESGSGKSSLGRALLHLVETRSGEVFYQDHRIGEMTEKEFRQWRRKIQFIFQDPYSSLNPKISVGDALIEVLKIHGLHGNAANRKQRCLDLLAQVGLEPADYDKYPHQFSGGQRQRVVIARALAVEPEFIVCDEAVSALDVSVQAQILNLLKDLKSTYQLTYLFITHDMSVVRFFCDRVIVMKEGELVEENSTEQLFENPEHPYSKKLIDITKSMA